MTVNNVTREQAAEMIADKYISTSEAKSLGLTEKEMIELNDALNGGILSVEDCLDKLVKKEPEKTSEAENKSEEGGWEFYRKDKKSDNDAISIIELMTLGMTAFGAFFGGINVLANPNLRGLGEGLKMTAKSGLIGLAVSSTIAGFIMLLNTGIQKK